MVTVTIRAENIGTNKDRTIYATLRDKLGREPSNMELRNECHRIISEARALDLIERAAHGRLPWQRK